MMRQPNQLLTELEFKEWQQHPVTVQFRRALQMKADDYVTGWETGAYTGSTADETVQLNSLHLGHVKALRAILTMEYDDLVAMLTVN